MTTLEIVIIAVVAGLALLAAGGMAANARSRRRREPQFEASLDEVNRRLADAHAQDKGWERGPLEQFARDAFVRRRPGEEIRDQALVAVIDRPGTEEDKAVFRFTTDGGVAYLTLGRVDGAWVDERLE